MKKLLIASLFALTCSAPLFAATITQWTFEAPNTPADQNNVTTSAAVAPAVGTGSAIGVHGSADTDYSSPAGNGSTESFSSNNWVTLDRYQFSVSTANFTGDLYVSFSQNRSGTGPSNFSLQYSSTGAGGPFTDFAAYTVDPFVWNAAVPVPASFKSFDLSAINALDDNPNVVFRLTATLGAASGGTNRVDDFTVSDTPVPAPVPEPSTVLTLIGGLGMLSILRRRGR